MSEFAGGNENINRNGRPKGSGRKISPLKTVFNKLKKLSDKAIENIEKSVNGENVGKEVVNTSKWVVTTLQSYHKTILAEEEQINLPKDSETETEEIESPSSVGFRLKQVK